MERLNPAILAILAAVVFAVVGVGVGCGSDTEPAGGEEPATGDSPDAPADPPADNATDTPADDSSTTDGDNGDESSDSGSGSADDPEPEPDSPDGGSADDDGTDDADGTDGIDGTDGTADGDAADTTDSTDANGSDLPPIEKLTAENSEPGPEAASPRQPLWYVGSIDDQDFSIYAVSSMLYMASVPALSRDRAITKSIESAVATSLQRRVKDTVVAYVQEVHPSVPWALNGRGQVKFADAVVKRLDAKKTVVNIADGPDTANPGNGQIYVRVKVTYADFVDAIFEELKADVPTLDRDTLAEELELYLFL
jgi:hypothetical protein